METSFKQAFELTVEKHERMVLVNDPDDTGGRTFAGITSRWYPEWKGWRLLDENLGQANLEEISSLVKKFYLELWGDMHCDKMDLSVARIVFDVRVLQGPQPAGLVLQRGMNIANDRQRLWRDLEEDGWIGQNTRSMLSLVESKNLLNRVVDGMIAARCEMLYNLIRKKPENEKFFGWIHRALDPAFRK